MSVRKRMPTALVALAGSLAFAGLMMGLAVWVVGPLLQSGRARNESGPAACLKMIASAQADFRGNDRDDNRQRDYWRADVAGLYAVKPEGEDRPLALIMPSLARADAAPAARIAGDVVRSPLHGYWVKALRHAGEDPAMLDPKRFAAVAYPAENTRHRRVFIVSEANTVHQRAWAGPSDTPAVYPADPLKEGWSPVP